MSGWGANVATTAPAAFTCASLAMSCPPMRLKLPPTNHPPAPSDTIARTPPPSIFGKTGAVGSPCASSATAELTHGVTLANDPPRYRLSPVRSTALTVPSTLTEASGVGESAADAVPQDERRGHDRGQCQNPDRWTHLATLAERVAAQRRYAACST